MFQAQKLFVSLNSGFKSNKEEKRRERARIPARSRKVDIMLPGKEDSNSHGARPVHQIISIIEVDSDQQVVNGELSLLRVEGCGEPRR